MKLTFGVNLRCAEPVPEFISLVRMAEAAGFEYLWLVDSVLSGRDVFSYLTLAGVYSERMKLGPGVIHPYTRHFATAVNAMRTLEEQVPGRAILGLGTGGSSVGQLGFRQAKLAAIRELIELSRRLMRGETVSSDLPEMPLFDAHLTFPDQVVLPVWLAATGPRMLRLSGEIADGVMAHVGAAPAAVQEAMRLCQEGASARGDLPPLEFSPYIYTSVSDDPAMIMAECRSGVGALLSRTPVYGRMAGVSEEALEEIVRARTRAELNAALSEDTIRRLSISGTPAQCARQIEQLADADVRHITLVLVGSRIEETLRVCGTEIIPRFI